MFISTEICAPDFFWHFIIKQTITCINLLTKYPNHEKAPIPRRSTAYDRINRSKLQIPKGIAHKKHNLPRMRCEARESTTHARCIPGGGNGKGCT